MGEVLLDLRVCMYMQTCIHLQASGLLSITCTQRHTYIHCCECLQKINTIVITISIDINYIDYYTSLHIRYTSCKRTYKGIH